MVSGMKAWRDGVRRKEVRRVIAGDFLGEYCNKAENYIVTEFLPGSRYFPCLNVGRIVSREGKADNVVAGNITLGETRGFSIQI